MKSQQQLAQEAREYVQKAHSYKCSKCGIGFLRLRKVRCPFCKGTAVEQKEE